MAEQTDEVLGLKIALEKDLLMLYGPVLTGESLIKALGYISKDAFRQSIVRNTVPVPLFEMDHRRGKYALAKDIASYLAQKRFSSNHQKEEVITKV